MLLQLMIRVGELKAASFQRVSDGRFRRSREARQEILAVSLPKTPWFRIFADK